MSKSYSDKDFPEAGGRAEKADVVILKDREPTEALAVLEKVRALEVVDQASLTAMNDLLVNATAWLKHCDEEFDKGIHDADAHHKDLVAQKRKWAAPAMEVRAIARPKVAAFLRAEDDKRREAERTAQRAKEVAAKEAQDTADVAHEFIAQGRFADADAVVEMQAKRIEEIRAATPAVPEKPVAPGSSLIKRWTWDREHADIEAMAKDEHARKFLKVDEAKVTRYVQNMKWDAKIAGVRIYSEDDVSTRIGK